MINNINNINNSGVEKATTKSNANQQNNVDNRNNNRATQDNAGDSYDTTSLHRSELMSYIDNINKESQSMNHSKIQDLVEKVRSGDSASMIKSLGNTSNLTKLTIEMIDA